MFVYSLTKYIFSMACIHGQGTGKYSWWNNYLSLMQYSGSVWCCRRIGTDLQKLNAENQKYTSSLEDGVSSTKPEQKSQSLKIVQNTTDLCKK